MTRAEKKNKLFNMIMEAQRGCSPVQFSIYDRSEENVSATIYEISFFALMKLFKEINNEPGFARIEVNHGETMIICW